MPDQKQDHEIQQRALQAVRPTLRSAGVTASDMELVLYELEAQGYLVIDGRTDG